MSVLKAMVPMTLRWVTTFIPKMGTAHTVSAYMPTDGQATGRQARTAGSSIGTLAERGQFGSGHVDRPRKRQGL